MSDAIAERPALGRVVLTGLRRSAHTGSFLVRMILPLSLGVALLQWTGVLSAIGRVLAPAMGLFGLPGEAAIALVSGYFGGVYGGVAAASAVALTRTQMTVLALMVLVAHNLVVESAVQSRSGASGLRITAVRIVTASLLGAGLWQTLRHGGQGSARAAIPLASEGEPGLPRFLESWAWGAAKLTLKIFVILALLMVANEIMREYGVFQTLSRPLQPLMRLLGLSERVTFLWLTGTFLGIAYGAGLIMQEAREHGRFRAGDLPDLHVSLGISHSLLEDTILFAAIGANPVWILVPRPIAAAAAVRLVRRFMPGVARPLAAEQA